MNVLFLAPYPPYPPRGGGQQRMYQWLRLLAERHEVSLLTFVADDAADAALDPLRAVCTVETVRSPRHTVSRRLRTLFGSSMPDMVLRGNDDAFARTLERCLVTTAFDVVQAESIEMAQYGRATAKERGRRPLWVYDAFNAEYLIQRRAFFADLRRMRRWPVAAYSLLQWHKLRRYEQTLERRFDLALTVSQPDQRCLHDLAPRLRTAVVPNGVDTTAFRRRADAAPAASPMLLFTGTLDYRPNTDAVLWFVANVWPMLHTQRTDLRFCVVGQRPPPALLALNDVPGVEIVGLVDDVRPWFEQAAMFVLPMRVGGGVRLKLLETWAMELPCVTTAMGAEGVEGFVAGEHALVADGAETLRSAIERLLDDPSLRQRLARNGRRLVEERYDWRPIVAQMEHAWVNAINASHIAR